MGALSDRVFKTRKGLIVFCLLLMGLISLVLAKISPKTGLFVVASIFFSFGLAASGGMLKGMQVAIFDWAALYENQYPALHWMYAIPNAGKRSKAEGARMRREGRLHSTRRFWYVWCVSQDQLCFISSPPEKK